MIFIFVKDGTLEIVDSEIDVFRECEGVDAESGVFDFFDENGSYLKPVFSIPNKYTKSFFSLFNSVVSGVYNLVPAPDECEETFEAMLCDVSILYENKYYKSLKELKVKFNVGI